MNRQYARIYIYIYIYTHNLPSSRLFDDCDVLIPPKRRLTLGSDEPNPSNNISENDEPIKYKSV